MNSALTPTGGSSPPQKTWTDRVFALRDEDWQLHDECIALARKALEHYKAQGEQKLKIPDIERLLSLADKLGRLATGMATDHVEHAWSRYHDPVFIAQLEKECAEVFAQPIDVQSEQLPTTNEPSQQL